MTRREFLEDLCRNSSSAEMQQVEEFRHRVSIEMDKDTRGNGKSERRISNGSKRS
jgi:hypothetical protein